MIKAVNKKRERFYKIFFDEDYHLPLSKYLEGSTADEIFTIDVLNDTFNIHYYIEDKYPLPFNEMGSYREIFEYTLNNIIHPEDRDVYNNLMNPDTLLERLKNSTYPNFLFDEFRWKLSDGSYRYTEHCLITGAENGLDKGIVQLYIFDLQNAKLREQGETHFKSIYNANRFDQLTGLYKSNEFFHNIAITYEKEPNKKWCVIAIDLEHFKLFNDWYGRETGDFLLSRIGVILNHFTKEEGTFAGYFGKDNFALFVEYNEKKIKALYEEVKETIATYGQSIGFLPSFGIAFIDPEYSMEDIYDHATIASSKAKLDTREHISLYDSHMHLSEGYEYRVISNFMKALQNNEITFYLQPQCRISTGKIVGAESLARWINKDGSIIMPNDYIPILEKYGFIIDLDRYLWERVCMWLRNWIDLGHRPVPISLNVSRADIMAIDVLECFNMLSKKYKLDHKLLKLEITESAYSQNTDTVTELVQNLREQGYTVLMDDFGSGYSSLNMLSTLTIDAIKLDAMFLNIKESDYEKGIHILESVINMAKQIAVPIIVEGVETQEQSDFLEDLGCRYVQGFHFYRPMPRDKFEQLISNEENIDERGFVAKLNEQYRVREFLDKNVYSDSMLNAIIGPVAFYSYDGNTVDIVRFNQQFYEAVNVPDFHERLTNIERWMPKEDIPLMHKAMEDAIKDRLNGASGFFRFYRTNGLLTNFHIHFFYLGKVDNEHRFYGAAENFTDYTDVKDFLKLIGRHSNDSFIFLLKLDNEWHFQVGTFAIAKELGYTLEEAQHYFDSDEYKKVFASKEDFVEIVNLLDDKKDFTRVTELYRKDDKKPIKVKFDFECTAGEVNNVEYFLSLTKVE